MELSMEAQATSDPFGTDNMDVSIDAQGIATIRLDSKRTISHPGEAKANGQPRKNALIASSHGVQRIGHCKINLNVTKA